MENRQGKAPLDRVSWIGLILAALLLAVYIHTSGKIAKEKAVADAAKREAAAALEAEKKGGEGDAEGTQDGEGTTAGTEEAEPEPEVAEEMTVLKHGNVEWVFSNKGGGIKYAELADQQEVGDDSTNVRINRYEEEVIGALVNGTDDFIDGVYRVESGERFVEYLGKAENGLIVKKRWSFLDEEERGSEYRLKLELIVENQTDATFDLSRLNLFAGGAAPLYQREWEPQTGVFYNQKGDFKYKKSGWFKKNDLYQRSPKEDVLYTGVSNQFFANIITPKEPYAASLWAKSRTIELAEAAGGGSDKSKIALRAAMSLPVETLAPKGGKEAVEYEFYIGPKRNSVMRGLGNDRGNVMNYGWFGWISSPLSHVLTFLHDKVFDHISHKWSWGLSIIALTILIRSAMWPLQNKSTRSMKRMSKLQPEMAKLKEKYPDDPQKQQQEMMKLYREYKINPVGGCLPMLVQIPIFFGFYRMLQFAVELRQQEFLWVKDLSQPDTLYTFNLPFSLPFLGNELPINVLPIVMSATMVLQMALTPKTGDKMQQRIFMLMPLIFFFFCYSFASALALYWTTSNIFAIVQMMITKRLPEPELKKAAPGKGKKTFFERLQEKAEEAQRMQKAGGKQTQGAPAQKPKKPRGPRTGG